MKLHSNIAKEANEIGNLEAEIKDNSIQINQNTD